MKPMQRKRMLGPTQVKVLCSVRDHPGGAMRCELVTATQLSREQVISALRGLLRRGVVTRTRTDGAHVTAPYTWRAV